MVALFKSIGSEFSGGFTDVNVMGSKKIDFGNFFILIISIEVEQRRNYTPSNAKNYDTNLSFGVNKRR